jgi:hypothetical protein
MRQNRKRSVIFKPLSGWELSIINHITTPFRHAQEFNHTSPLGATSLVMSLWPSNMKNCVMKLLWFLRISGKMFADDKVTLFPGIIPLISRLSFLSWMITSLEAARFPTRADGNWKNLRNAS